MNYYLLNMIGIILFTIGEIALIKQGFLLWAIIIVVDALVWAIVCKKVVENKGYKEDWFWWGFWFNIFAFLVAISKPNKHLINNDISNNLNYDNDSNTSRLSDWANEERNKRMLREGGWQCKNCDKINYKAVVTCSCGGKRTDKYEEIDKLSAQLKLEDSGWKCNNCRKLNSKNVFICSCGVKKSQNDTIEPKNEEKIENLQDNIEIIKKYKELLDMGAITQEEFEQKKKNHLDI